MLEATYINTIYGLGIQMVAVFLVHLLGCFLWSGMSKRKAKLENDLKHKCEGDTQSLVTTESLNEYLLSINCFRYTRCPG